LHPALDDRVFDATSSVNRVLIMACLLNRFPGVVYAPSLPGVVYAPSFPGVVYAP